MSSFVRHIKEEYFPGIVWLFFLLMNSLLTNAQNNFQVIKYSLNNSAYRIHEDTAGFIWISSEAGIFRFDGQESVRVRIDSSIIDDFVYSFQKRSDEIYFQNYTGSIVRINIRPNGQYTTSVILSKRGDAPKYKNNVFFQDENLMIQEKNQFGSLDLFKVKNKSLIPILHNQNESFRVIGLYNSSLYFYEDKNWKFIKVKTGSREVLKDFNHNNLIFANANHTSSDSGFFYMEENKLNFYDVRKDSICFITQFDNLVFSDINLLKIDLCGNIWVLTSNGAWLVGNDGNKKLLNNCNVFDVFESRNRNYYWYTEGKGIYGKIYKSTKHHKYLEDISSVEGSDENIFITHDRKLVNGNNKKETLLLLSDYLIGNYEVMKVIYNADRYFVFTSKGILIFSKTQFSIDYEQLIKGQLHQDKFLSRFKNGYYYYYYYYSIKNVISVNDSSVFMSGGYSGILNFLTQRNKITIKYIMPENVPILKIIQSNDKLFYLTQSNLYHYVPSTNTSKLILSSIYPLKDVESNHSTMFFLAFRNNGLGIYRNNKLYYYNVKNSNLCSNEILTLAYIGGKLCIGTTLGFQTLAVNNNFTFYKPYSFNNTLPIKQIVSTSENDALIFSKYNPLGLIYNLDTNDTIIRPAKIYIKNISGSFIGVCKGEAVLRYLRNSLTIHVSCLDYIQQHIKYYYSIKSDNEKDAFIPMLGSTLNLSFLKSGNYTIKVYGINENSIKTNYLNFKFVVETPLWKEPWMLFAAALLILIVLIFITAYFYKRKIKQQRIEQDNKYKLLEIEQKLFLSQMNPHFIFNALNSIRHLIIDKKNDDATNKISAFSSLIRRNLQDSSDNFVSLSNELNKLKEYVDVENSRFENQLKLEIKLSSHLNLDMVYVPNFILQPILENSIIHGLAPKHGGCIELLISNISNEEYEILVLDNGVGLDKSLQKNIRPFKKSVALNLISERFYKLKNTYNKKFEIYITNRIDFDRKEGTVCRIIFTSIPPNYYQKKD